MSTITHKKNTARYLVFPLVNALSPAFFLSGSAPAIASYSKSGSGSWTNFTPTNSITEIGTTGVYQLTLSAGETNFDFVFLKFSATNAADTMFVFDMRTKITDDLPVAQDVRDSLALTTTATLAAGSIDIQLSKIVRPSIDVD